MIPAPPPIFRVCCLAMACTLFLQIATAQQQPDVLYVPTPYLAVDKMLEMAGVNSRSVVYDLGCGDGRIVIEAAKKYGAHGVGVDVDPERIRESRENAQRAGVTDLVEFRQADLFETDLHAATVVTLYLLPELNLRLRPQLLNQLRPGTPIISHDFNMGDWEPEQTVFVDAPDRRHTLYRWTVPPPIAGTWQVKTSMPASNLTLEIRQDEFRISGTLLRGEQHTELVNGSLRGANVTFDVEDEGHFSGKVIEEKIEGEFTGNGKPQVWVASRAGKP